MTTVTAGSVRSGRTEQTRAAIVAAAHDAFVTRGYRATSLRDIAAESGKPIPDAFSQAVMAALHNPTKNALADVANKFWAMQGKLMEGDDAFHKRKGLEDDLAKALDRLKKALGDLGDATTKRKQPEAIAAAKEVRSVSLPLTLTLILTSCSWRRRYRT